MLRKLTFPIILILFGIAVIIWQVYEHQRFVLGGKTALQNRARDIANTLAVVIRSQRFFGGIIFQHRLEVALYDLIQAEDLLSVVLFNKYGEVVCWAGRENEPDIENLTESYEKWDEETATFVNLIDLGIDPRRDHEDERTLIVSDEERDLLRKMRPRSPFRGRDREDGPPPEGPPPPPPGEISDNNIDSSTNPMKASQDNNSERRFRDFQPRFHRPRGISEQEYQSLLQRTGLHGFAIEMSTLHYNMAKEKDLWMRFSITGFAFVAILGFWLAWRNLIKSSDLQVRLVRASEMNTYLREMNFAAAGLAHETRNPLNLVRGFAQVIAKDEKSSGQIRHHATKITEEVDRVTAQLNEFINYSKPREAKQTPVNLRSIVQDVERTLTTDLEDKHIQFHMDIPAVTIEADEGLLRQVIFNLLLNSIQAVEEHGSITIRTGHNQGKEFSLEIIDNGPGVRAEDQDKIFSPYFTTRHDGTGLGLAVVKQIVSAHGWDIKYIDSNEKGATFRIHGIKTLTKDS